MLPDRARAGAAEGLAGGGAVVRGSGGSRARSVRARSRTAGGGAACGSGVACGGAACAPGASLARSAAGATTGSSTTAGAVDGSTGGAIVEVRGAAVALSGAGVGSRISHHESAASTSSSAAPTTARPRRRMLGTVSRCSSIEACSPEPALFTLANGKSAAISASMLCTRARGPSPSRAAPRARARAGISRPQLARRTRLGVRDREHERAVAVARERQRCRSASRTGSRRTRRRRCARRRRASPRACSGDMYERRAEHRAFLGQRRLAVATRSRRCLEMPKSSTLASRALAVRPAAQEDVVGLEIAVDHACACAAATPRIAGSSSVARPRSARAARARGVARSDSPRSSSITR